jgi:hypothetical protein
VNSLAQLSLKQLRRATAVKAKIESLEKQLDHIFNGPRKPLDGAPHRKKRKMSASARAKIAKAQKARWAKFKAAKQK